MSTSLDPRSSPVGPAARLPDLPDSSEPERKALDFLKGQENPFDSLARPQRMDDCFLDLHVSELLAAERKLLLDIIDSYRVAEYSRSADLRPTRVVTIRGDRGAGKTHLLQSLCYREDGQSQILIRPGFYEPNLTFEEYLLGQLVAVLSAEDEVYRSRPIEDIAAALTRRLLRQTLRALGPTERLCLLAPGGWTRFRLLFGGGEKRAQTLERLAIMLETDGGLRELPAAVKRHDVTLEQCQRLIEGHLRRFEVGTDLVPLLRRRLYADMARAALLQDNDPLLRFLEGEYTQLGPTATRGEIVNRLLHAMIEVCALVRQPIVLAFDNLERIFSPQNRFDGDLVRSFFNNLAQGVDNTKGLLVLLFAEKGLMEQAANHMDEFARHRLSQGVPVFGRGPVSMIDLQAPSPQDIRVLIHNRVGRLLSKGSEALRVPDGFPFGDRFLSQTLADNQNLRNTLMRLRDAYSAKVYEGTDYEQPAAVEEKPAPVNWDSLLESTWPEHLAAARRKLEGAVASHVQELHAGLASVLQPLIPFASEGWELTRVQATATISDKPVYGIVSLLDWRRQGQTDDNGSVLTVGVGFLLGRGAGMPADLRCKLDFFRRPAKGDRLLILWQGPADVDDLSEALPAATRTIWTASRYKSKTAIHRTDINDLTALLAFPEWLSSVQADPDRRLPPEILQAFIKEKFDSFLTSIARPTSIASNEHQMTETLP